MRSCVGTLPVGGVYALRKDLAEGVLDRAAARLAAPFHSLSGSWYRLSRIIPVANRQAEAVSGLSDEALRQRATALRHRLKATRLALPAVAESFALIRELAGRRLGTRHFDVQLAGAWAMLNGMVAEMETGEGKTLTATLTAGTAALAGIPVHLITVNDYLAARDAEAMRPVYEALGLSVGAALGNMGDDERRSAYACDVTYTTNKQVAFDHLRDRIALRGRNSQLGLHFPADDRSPLLLRGLHFALIDEADSVLVDEAVTPLIISRRGAPVYPREMLVEALDKARSLRAGEHFTLQRDIRRIRLLPAGKDVLSDGAGQDSGLWHNTRYREELVTQALRALLLFDRDRHYLVDDGKVKIIDEFTGRLMADRSWEQGLHQLIEVKEGCEITGEMETLGRISYQRFFRRYLMLGGMSGTAREVAGELRVVYGLAVARIPTNRPTRRASRAPRVFVGETDKWLRIVERIRACHAQGRPVLVGTRSVAASEFLSALLADENLPHRVLNARQDAAEAEIIAQAGLHRQITVATNMAGRGTDIRLEPGVAALGGLHVIATERHEARRIDRQLFGRCGRQGDPGSHEEFSSLDDELLRGYLPLWLRRTAQLLARGGPLCGPALVMMLWLAQRRAQRKNFRARVQMQKLDEYLENVLAFSGRRE